MSHPCLLAFRRCHLLLVRCRLQSAAIQSSRTQQRPCFVDQHRAGLHTARPSPAVTRRPGQVGASEAEPGLPDNLRLIYATDSKNFIYLAQALEALTMGLSVLPPLLIGVDTTGPESMWEPFIFTPLTAALTSAFLLLHTFACHKFVAGWVSRVYYDEEEDIFLALTPHPFWPLRSRKVLFESGGVGKAESLPDAFSKNMIYVLENCETEEGKPLGRKYVFLDPKNFAAPVYFHKMFEK